MRMRRRQAAGGAGSERVGDYYRLLLCAEIDALDAEGKALEIKFDGNDTDVSVCDWRWPHV